MAQECSTYAPFKKGTRWELVSYNKRGKVESKTHQEILKVEQTDSSIKAEVLQQIVDKKGMQINSSTYVMECVGGRLKVSMVSIMNKEMMKSYQGMQIEVNADELILPEELKVGQELNNGRMSVSMAAGGGITVLNMNVVVSNRKVTSEQSITTDAGTYDCMVIGYDVETSAIVTSKGKVVEWYAKGVGVVRSEYYNKNGTLTGYTLLEDFTNP